VADDHPTPQDGDGCSEVSTDTTNPSKPPDGDVDEAYENVEPAE
jgi:hypothetical protein